eukprot:scaffold87116_cov42-Prasinocladus_malaysianus.AAC.1
MKEPAMLPALLILIERLQEVEINGHKREAVFEDASGRRIREKYDLLVGADGSNSTVREKLAERGSLSFYKVWKLLGLGVSNTEENQRDYKSFVLDKELWESEPEYANKMLTWSSVDGS